MTEWIDIHSVESSSAHSDQFWESIGIWNRRPHVVNRRLLGSEKYVVFTPKNTVETDGLLRELADQVIDAIRKACCSQTDVLSKSEAERILYDFDNLDILDSAHDESIGSEDGRGDMELADVYFELKKLIPKMNSTDCYAFEMTLFDKKNDRATFYKVFSSSTKHPLIPDYNYRLKFKNGMFILSVENRTKLEGNNNAVVDKSGTNVASLSSVNYDFLVKKLMPRLLTWTEHTPAASSNLVKGSLKCVPVGQYCLLYNKLKETYGKTFVEIWPESTDPLKFVYEDIAIATYLILLWKEEKQRFVDLGCGNGLLVYILNSEGHSGYGVDVRPRKIWQLYPTVGDKGVPPDLRVGTVTPTNMNVFPDSDWLIGNHSDELTPWIPVFAAKSSYSCKFFLLPCCPYEFNGEKYQRRDSSLSRYVDYLNYVVDVCDTCGFDSVVDKLRIPSTKRICILGESRKYAKEDTESVYERIDEMIKTKCLTNRDEDGGKNEGLKFKARQSIENVTNCTQLEKGLINKIISLTAERLLLGTDDRITNGSPRSSCGHGWNEGALIPLGELAKLIPKEYLVQLKKEGNGIQTLLKNHHHIFVVQGGKVGFRKPMPCSAPLHKRTTPCWFYSNHPDSCPLDSAECKYLHANGS